MCAAWPERRSAGMTASAWRTSAGTAARIPVARCTNLVRTLKDFAAATVVVATTDGHENTVYELGGDEAWDFAGFTAQENRGKALFVERCNLCHHIGESKLVQNFGMFRTLRVLPRTA